MKKTIKMTTVLVLVSFFVACKEAPVNEEVVETTIEAPETQPLDNVMTKEQQQKLTPDDVLKDFIDGNNRFHSGNITRRNHSE